MAKFLNSTLLLLIVASSLMATNADFFIVNGTQISEVSVRGLLTCSVSGSLPMAPPLVGVNVTLSCNGSQTTLGQAVTNPAGLFEIVVRAANATVSQPSANCIVYAQLTPSLNCTVFPPTGVLQSSLRIVGVVGSAVGNVLSIIPILFTLVNVN